MRVAMKYVLLIIIFFYDFCYSMEYGNHILLMFNNYYENLQQQDIITVHRIPRRIIMPWFKTRSEVSDCIKLFDEFLNQRDVKEVISLKRVHKIDFDENKKTLITYDAQGARIFQKKRYYFNLKAFNSFYKLIKRYLSTIEEAHAFTLAYRPTNADWENALDHPSKSIQFFLYFPSIRQTTCIDWINFQPIEFKENLNPAQAKLLCLALERFLNNTNDMSQDRHIHQPLPFNDLAVISTFLK